MGSERRGLSWRRRAVGATAVTAAVGLMGLPGVATAAVVPATSPVALVDWSDGSGGWSGHDEQSWGQGGGSSATTVDAQPATTAESVGVVLIDTELAYEGGAGAGTGIVLTSDGEVATNYHVVEGATTIQVTIATTGTSYTASVVGHSAVSDVAVLKLKDAKGLTPARIDDDTVALGDEVTAVGNAGGTGTLTAADGSVTDLSSSITTASEGPVASETLTGLIETDADVVPGDSGGPLLDAEGEVVGIDTAASSGSSIDGYAIPIDDVLAVVKQVASGTETSTVQIGANPFLGVQVTETTMAYAGDFASTNSGSGALVAGVLAGSPAEQAGLSVGDVITAVNSTQVDAAYDLSTLLAAHNAGDTVTITWTDSSGASHHATVTLAASPTA